ncbi:lipopolysaccharide transport periplasmic protein LptA [Rhodovulum euryhalinum]|uniref:Lipopolysaccharide export system protein LptA n=1 Tax=Rhodovulum euryhalinum TaxID=35805 RepID=A0A4R2KAY7_9RHOB|nr:lipopolysaccharide transport periplasmic protein LptA [Rhodovulum euryhalinum]TCO69934.1 lipopolysaccharide export system protein LptA [Rhodovulum euryhalinum]
MSFRVALATLALALDSSFALAQGAEIAFGALAHDRTQPVEVTAERLSVDQTDGTAVFTGGVLVGQGDMRLSADQVLVVYDSPEAASRRIARMEASGKVVLALGAEAAEAERAVYTIDSGTIVMTGSVLLTQGQSAISGERLVVDLNRGTGAMEGRVRTVLQPGGAQ